jgi:hypothetical protein
MYVPYRIHTEEIVIFLAELGMGGKRQVHVRALRYVHGHFAAARVLGGHLRFDVTIRSVRDFVIYLAALGLFFFEEFLHRLPLRSLQINLREICETTSTQAHRENDNDSTIMTVSIISNNNVYAKTDKSIMHTIGTR